MAITTIKKQIKNKICHDDNEINYVEIIITVEQRTSLQINTTSE